MKILTGDLLSVIYAYGAFLLAYSANILFSLYLNIELLKQDYSKEKMLKSLKKAIILVLATLMLVIAVDVVAIYFSVFIPTLNDEIREAVTVVAIIATIGQAALLYIIEAYRTFKNILTIRPTVKSPEGIEND